jgi:hypothetical protein
VSLGALERLPLYRSDPLGSIFEPSGVIAVV